MRKVKKFLFAAAIAVLLAATIGAIVLVARQMSFFSAGPYYTTSYVEDTEDSPLIGAFSERVGIEFDSGLEQHASILNEMERFVVCSDTLQFTQTEEGWFRGSLDRTRADLSGWTMPENPLYIYTGSFKDRGYIVNVALFDVGRLDTVGNYIPAFQLAVQLRPESGMFPLGDRDVDIETDYSDFHWENDILEEENACQSIYLYSEQANCWFKKETIYDVLESGGSIPTLMIRNRIGKADLVQLWGTSSRHDVASDTSRVHFNFYLGDSFWGDLSFWYPDSIYH